MSAFEKCKDSPLNKEFQAAMVPVMRELAGGGAPTPLEAQEKDKLFELQSLGDYISWNVSKSEQYRFELKVEPTWTGNLFIESWSNRQDMRQGWFHTLKVDALLYGFPTPDRVVFVIPWKKLREFLWHPKYRVDKMPFVQQRKHIQHNDTWGWLVPVEELKREKVIYKTLDW
jgi:hypothetical protein